MRSKVQSKIILNSQQLRDTSQSIGKMKTLNSPIPKSGMSMKSLFPQQQKTLYSQQIKRNSQNDQQKQNESQASLDNQSQLSMNKLKSYSNIPPSKQKKELLKNQEKLNTLGIVYPKWVFQKIDNDIQIDETTTTPITNNQEFVHSKEFGLTALKRVDVHEKFNLTVFTSVQNRNPNVFNSQQKYVNVMSIRHTEDTSTIYFNTPDLYISLFTNKDIKLRLSIKYGHQLQSQAEENQGAGENPTNNINQISDQQLQQFIERKNIQQKTDVQMLDYETLQQQVEDIMKKRQKAIIDRSSGLNFLKENKKTRVFKPFKIQEQRFHKRIQSAQHFKQVSDRKQLINHTVKLEKWEKYKMKELKLEALNDDDIYYQNIINSRANTVRGGMLRVQSANQFNLHPGTTKNNYLQNNYYTQQDDEQIRTPVTQKKVRNFHNFDDQIPQVNSDFPSMQNSAYQQDSNAYYALSQYNQNQINKAFETQQISQDIEFSQQYGDQKQNQIKSQMVQNYSPEKLNSKQLTMSESAHISFKPMQKSFSKARMHESTNVNKKQQKHAFQNRQNINEYFSNSTLKVSNNQMRPQTAHQRQQNSLKSSSNRNKLSQQKQNIDDQQQIINDEEDEEAYQEFIEGNSGVDELL